MMNKDFKVAGKDSFLGVSLDNSIEKGEIIAYQADGELHIDVRIENDTVWLTQAQMAELFNVQRQAITKHVRNIYKCSELKESTTSSILELVQNEGNRNVKRLITLYNLDMIISVGFRVNTHRGIEFRQWANQVLKDHLLKGYSINQRLLYAEERIDNRLAKQSIFIESHQQSIDDHSTRIAALERQKQPKNPWCSSTKTISKSPFMAKIGVQMRRNALFRPHKLQQTIQKGDFC